jgi:hypothetical protein
MNTMTLERLPSVNGALSYLVPMAEKPRSYEFELPAGVPRTTASYEQRIVPIRNVRPVAANISLDREGFLLATAPTAVRGFDDDETIRRVYYRENERLLKDITGAVRSVIFDHTIRRRLPGAVDRTDGIPRQPVPRVHNDYTTKSAPQRARMLLGDDAHELLGLRFSVINIWRPIRGPLRDSPLAISDAQSIAADDLVATDLVYPDRTGEIYNVKFNLAHRWFYAPDMQEDEVLIFKCFDSAEDGRARFVPHAAFADPTTPADVLPRESIELRTFVFYPN